MEGVKYDQRSGCFIVFREAHDRKRLKLGTSGSKSNGVHTINHDYHHKVTLILPEIFLMKNKTQQKKKTKCALIQTAITLRQKGWVVWRNPILLTKLWIFITHRLDSIFNSPDINGDDDIICTCHHDNGSTDDPFHTNIFHSAMFLIKPGHQIDQWKLVWLILADSLVTNTLPLHHKKEYLNNNNNNDDQIELKENVSPIIVMGIVATDYSMAFLEINPSIPMNLRDKQLKPMYVDTANLTLDR